MSSVVYNLPFQPAQPSLRLIHGIPQTKPAVYRRRRILAAIVGSIAAYLLVMGVIAAASDVSSIASSGGSSAAPVLASVNPDNVVTVGSGDTLWSIVTAAYPGKDPRPIVTELNKARHGAQLQIGDKIVLPSQD